MKKNVFPNSAISMFAIPTPSTPQSQNGGRKAVPKMLLKGGQYMARPVKKKPIETPKTKYIFENGLYVKILLPRDFIEKIKKSVYTENEAKMNVLTVAGSKPLFNKKIYKKSKRTLVRVPITQTKTFISTSINPPCLRLGLSLR